MLLHIYRKEELIVDADPYSNCMIHNFKGSGRKMCTGLLHQQA